MSEDAAPVYESLRIPTCQAGWDRCLPGIRGARFGQRSFVRVARIHARFDFATPHGDNGTRTVDETWKFTFSRCPKPQPC